MTAMTGFGAFLRVIFALAHLRTFSLDLYYKVY